MEGRGRRVSGLTGRVVSYSGPWQGVLEARVFRRFMLRADFCRRHVREEAQLGDAETMAAAWPPGTMLHFHGLLLPFLTEEGEEEEVGELRGWRLIVHSVWGPRRRDAPPPRELPLAPLGFGGGELVEIRGRMERVGPSRAVVACRPSGPLLEFHADGAFLCGLPLADVDLTTIFFAGNDVTFSIRPSTFQKFLFSNPGELQKCLHVPEIWFVVSHCDSVVQQLGKIVDYCICNKLEDSVCYNLLNILRIHLSRNIANLESYVVAEERSSIRTDIFANENINGSPSSIYEGLQKGSGENQMEINNCITDKHGRNDMFNSGKFISLEDLKQYIKEVDPFEFLHIQVTQLTQNVSHKSLKVSKDDLKHNMTAHHGNGKYDDLFVEYDKTLKEDAKTMFQTDCISGNIYSESEHVCSESEEIHYTVEKQADVVGSVVLFQPFSRYSIPTFALQNMFLALQRLFSTIKTILCVVQGILTVLRLKKLPIASNPNECHSLTSEIHHPNLKEITSEEDHVEDKKTSPVNRKFTGLDLGKLPADYKTSVRLEGPKKYESHNCSTMCRHLEDTIYTHNIDTYCDFCTEPFREFLEGMHVKEIMTVMEIPKKGKCPIHVNNQSNRPNISQSVDSDCDSDEWVDIEVEPITNYTNNQLKLSNFNCDDASPPNYCNLHFNSSFDDSDDGTDAGKSLLTNNGTDFKSDNNEVKEVQKVLKDAKDAFRDVKHVFQIQTAFHDVKSAIKEVRQACRGYTPGPRVLPPCGDATALGTEFSCGGGDVSRICPSCRKHLDHSKVQ